MIRSSYYQDTKPEDVVKDSRGMTFSIGDTVAYNLSGDVVIGTILEIKKNSWYCKRGNSWYLDFEMLVKLENENHISKIKNINGFVVIKI